MTSPGARPFDASTQTSFRAAQLAAALTRPGIGLIALLLLLPVAIDIYAFRKALIDDAYISMSYARQIADDGSWGMLPGRMANTSTSPLNSLLLAVASFLPGSVRDAALVLAVAEMMAMLVVLLKLSQHLFRDLRFGLIAFVSLAVNPLLLSTIGLEGMLFFTLMATSLLLFTQERYGLLGVCLGLLMLTRLDGALFVMLMLAFIPRNGRSLCLLSCIVVQLPWYAFAWTQLGGLIPDTLGLKVGELTWFGYSFKNGLYLYFTHYPLELIASFVAAPFALIALRRCEGDARRIAVLLVGYSLIHFAAYSVLGVPPFHWYYLQQAVPLTIAGALGLYVLLQGNVAGRLVGQIGVAAPVVLFLAVCWQNGWPFQEAPIHTNWASSSAYARIGGWLNENIPEDATVLMSGEVGTMFYYSERNLLDKFTDYNLATNEMAKQAQHKASYRAITNISSHWRDPQPPVACPSYIIEQTRITDGYNLAPILGPRYGGELVNQWDESTSWVDAGRVYLFRIPQSATADVYPGGCTVN